MSYRNPAAMILAVVVVALAWQEAATRSQAPAATAGDAVATGTANAPRTPWGEPDVQGIWSSGYIETPLERPDEFGGREFLTDEEVRQELARLARQQDHSTGGTARSTARPRPTRTQKPGLCRRGRHG